MTELSCIITLPDERDNIVECQTCNVLMYNSEIRNHVEKQKQKQSKNGEITTNLCITSNILEHVPKSYNTKAEKLIFLLSTNSEFISWDRTGTISVDNKRVSGTNIVKLVNDVVCKNQKTNDPMGWRKFANVLYIINSPLNIIGNPKRREYIEKLQKNKIKKERREQNKLFRQSKQESSGNSA